MIPEIRFETRKMQRGMTGKEASVPDLIGSLILQNDLEFHLDEEDEIYEGYGKRRNSYPYRQYLSYSRKLNEQEVKCVILENDFLRAEFLPELGGRMWSLLDKEKNRNLLYTNDVIRYSNLAVRNAWFSGGVEWNIGVIGHTPLTTEPMFVSVLENEDKVPVLRMYEYERIRQVTYQMDFWLGREDKFLNARMRIVNFGEAVVPMYWWSNMAVPEYENGRVIVPANKAYTSKNGKVYKVDIPVVDGIDVTHYRQIPAGIDYFFEIRREDPKYIANVDQDGYGLLQMSTSRLQSRKLFSWGNKQASVHWQEFLTEKAGRYFEIQAGLGKTQYGCIPMAPHTAWEWMERYGAIQLDEQEIDLFFETLTKKVTGQIKESAAFNEMEAILRDSKEMAKRKGSVCQKGSCYGALKNLEQNLTGKKEISSHLDFGEIGPEQKIWADYLVTGVLAEPEPLKTPPDFMTDEIYFKMLQQDIKADRNCHWYAYYHLGIFYFINEDYEAAVKALECSIARKENPWAFHGLASVYTMTGEKENAINMMLRGLELKKDDLSYTKEGMRILSFNRGFRENLQVYGKLEDDQKQESRIYFYYLQALSETGDVQTAFELLCQDGGLVVDDIREGEEAVGELWMKLYRQLYGENGELPYQFDFHSV